MNYFHEKINYMSTECSIKMGRSNPGTGGFRSHWHNSIEMIYGFKDEYDITAGKKDFHITSRDIVFIPSRTIHSFKMKDQPSRLYFLQFKATPLYVGGDIDRYKTTEDIFNPMMKDVVVINQSRDPELHPLMVDIVEDLISIMVHCRDGYRYKAISRVYEILSLLVQFHITTAEYSDEISENELDSCIQAMNFIENNYSEQITVDDAANYCGFNSKYFGRLFYRMTGKYFKDYVNDYRIKKVTELLLQNDMSVSDAAYSCGFLNIATFYRYFNKIYNCSPKQFISKYKA